MRIAFIGIGNVGSALAGNLLRMNHTVTVVARDPSSDNVLAALNAYPQLQVVPLGSGAIADAEIIFLATPFVASQDALAAAGDLSGKVLVDCTNPVGAGITHGLKSEQSGGEFIQHLVPGAKVVKAFSIYGCENFENNTYPGYGDLKPAMLIAGDDAAAKQTVATLGTELGWTVIDTGELSMALHLEHMALLWINMARKQGRGSGFVWAMLQR